MMITTINIYCTCITICTHRVAYCCHPVTETNRNKFQSN